MIKTHPQLPETWAQHHQVTVPRLSEGFSSQPTAAVGFPVSSFPVLSAQITQDSGWLFLPQPPSPGDGASSAAAVCGSSASLICPCSLSSDRKLPLSFPSQEISCGEALRKQTKSSLVQKEREHAHSCEENTKC